jgi:hypothetical protein
MTGCNVSLKIHFLLYHLEFFLTKLGYVNDEHDERFRQNVSSMEKRYQWEWNATLMADYCWQLKREAADTGKRKSGRKRF